MPDLEKRPPIPEPVKRELWGRAAGRCATDLHRELLPATRQEKPQATELLTATERQGGKPSGHALHPRTENQTDADN